MEAMLDHEFLSDFLILGSNGTYEYFSFRENNYAAS